MGSITPYNKYFKQPGALFLILPGCWGDSRAPELKNIEKKTGSPSPHPKLPVRPNLPRAIAHVLLWLEDTGWLHGALEASWWVDLGIKDIGFALRSCEFEIWKIYICEDFLKSP